MSLPPHDQVKSFQELMLLEELSPTDHGLHLPPGTSYSLYRSLRGPYQPQIAPGAFGGHVLSQSLVAAAKTVPAGFVCHSQSGNFLLPGNKNAPFYYLVEDIRTSFTFATRHVKVFQNEDPALLFQPASICFIAISSFKKETPQGSLDYQRTLDPQFLLKDPNASLDHLEEAPDADHPQWIEALATGKIKHQKPVHSIDVRKLEMQSYNRGKHVQDKVQASTTALSVKLLTNKSRSTT